MSWDANPTPDNPGVDDPGPGRRIGLDVGTVRIGVAASNRDATMAMPVETVQRSERDIDRLLEIVAEYRPVEIIVGLPRDLKGHGSQSVHHAVEVAGALMERLADTESQEPPIPIRFADERLTTVVATQAMRSSGRKARKQRGVIDQAAAVEILQTWLDGRAMHLENVR